MRQAYYGKAIINDCYPILQNDSLNTAIKTTLIREILMQKYTDGIHPCFYPVSELVGRVIVVGK